MTELLQRTHWSCHECPKFASHDREDNSSSDVEIVHSSDSEGAGFNVEMKYQWSCARCLMAIFHADDQDDLEGAMTISNGLSCDLYISANGSSLLFLTYSN